MKHLLWILACSFYDSTETVQTSWSTALSYCFLKTFASMVIGQTLPCFSLPSAANHRSLPILPPPPSSPFSTEFSPGPAMTASSHLGEHIWFCKHFIVHITFIVSKTLFGNVFNHCRSVTLGPSSSWLLSSLHFTNAALIIGFRYITQRK